MWLRIDPAALGRLALTNEATVEGERRRYHCTLPEDQARALVVVRNGMLLEDLAGRLVDATLGWDKGTRGFVFDVSRLHSKVTIHRVLTFQQAVNAKTLSDILRDAPQREKE